MAHHNVDVLFEEPPDNPEQAASLVRRLYAQNEQSMAHGLAFTGRPETRIRCDAHHVLKLRTSDRFNETHALRRIRHFAERDRRFAVAHPRKIWIALGGNDGYFVANLTPRLQPLHVLLRRATETQWRTWALETIIDMYVTLSASHGYGLDPGLSNFGMDGEGRFYYLDDEYYQASSMTFLVQAIQLWFRSHDWLRGAAAESLGVSLSSSVMTHFKDKHLLRLLSEELRNAYFQDQETADSFKIFLSALSRHLTPSKTVFTAAQNANDSRIAVLADIHANLPALEAVLEDLRKQDIQNAMILGDIVGYGPFPGDCVAAVRRSGFKILKGNHDHGIANASFEKGFSRYAGWVASWSYHRLNAEALRWLDELPLYIEGSDWLAVHGAPCDKYFFYGYVYQMTYENNLETLKSRNIRTCFHGHTHIPGIYHDNGTHKGFVCPDGPHSLEEYSAALVCPGSIGQPRNGSTDAQYLIYDTNDKNVTLRAIPYDIDQTLNAMRTENFPHTLIQRLQQGY